MIRLKPNITFNFNNGETFTISDYTGIYEATINPTGYGAPNILASAINATRFIFSSYLKEQQVDDNVTEIVAGVEYKVNGSGSFVYDTKTYSAGDIFISMLDGTPTLPNGLTLAETGRFNPVTTFVPIDVTTSDFTPSLVGINDITFPDSVYNVQMDVYDTVYAAGVGRPSGTYIVITDTVTVSGVTYRVGEVFTQGSSFTSSGSGSIVSFYTTTTDEDGNPDYVYFICAYYAWQALMEMNNRLVNSTCKCVDKLKTNLNKAWNIWYSIVNQFSELDGQIDISGIQTGLEEIVLLNKQCNC